MTRQRTAFAVLFVFAAIATIWSWLAWPAELAGVTVIGAFFIALLSLIRVVVSAIRPRRHVPTDRHAHQ